MIIEKKADFLYFKDTMINLFIFFTHGIQSISVYFQEQFLECTPHDNIIVSFSFIKNVFLDFKVII